jgi:hypothetical protein
MNPFGFGQLVLLALEGVARAVNPKLRRQDRRETLAFGLFYVAFLVGGILFVVVLVRALYFKK